jgi:hypothetical protein
VRAEAVIHRTHWGIGVRQYIDKLRGRQWFHASHPTSADMTTEL